MSARAWLALISGCLLLLAMGCGEEATPASWLIRFESDGGIVGADAVRVRLRVLSGDCASTGVVYQADVSRTGAVPVFGEIGAGAFGFEAVARNAACTIVARGCTATSLPLATGATVVTQLEPVGGDAPLCAASACVQGVCAPGSTDAGVGDAM